MQCCIIKCGPTFHRKVVKEDWCSHKEDFGLYFSRSSPFFKPNVFFQVKVWRENFNSTEKLFLRGNLKGQIARRCWNTQYLYIAIFIHRNIYISQFLYRNIVCQNIKCDEGLPQCIFLPEHCCALLRSVTWIERLLRLHVYHLKKAKKLLRLDNNY